MDRRSRSCSVPAWHSSPRSLLRLPRARRAGLLEFLVRRAQAWPEEEAREGDVEPFVRAGDRVAIVAQRHTTSNLVEWQALASGGERFVADASEHRACRIQTRAAAKNGTV